MISDLTSATLFVIGIWNSIAEFTVEVKERTQERLGRRLEELRLPSWSEAFFGMWRWWGHTLGVVASIFQVLIGGLEEWGSGVTAIVREASLERLEMPKSLSNKVVKGDVAARYVINSLLEIADSVASSNRREIVDTVLEVANVGAFDPLDPDDEIDPQDVPTVKQRLWRSAVELMTAAAVLFLPFAVAWVAALFYLKVWAGTESVPTLAQDSKRVRESGPHRARINRRRGPDLG